MLCPIFYGFFISKQKEQIEHVFCSGIRLVYSLHGWDDFTTLILSQEKSLRDYVFSYWRKFSLHLEKAEEAICYQNTWTAYLIATSPDKSWYKSMKFRKNSFFPKRLALRAQHTRIDWLEFDEIQCKQYEYFKGTTTLLNMFTYKYFIMPP